MNKRISQIVYSSFSKVIFDPFVDKVSSRLEGEFSVRVTIVVVIVRFKHVFYSNELLQLMSLEIRESFDFN